jgi:hypothetical protein
LAGTGTVCPVHTTKIIEAELHPFLNSSQDESFTPRLEKNSLYTLNKTRKVRGPQTFWKGGQSVVFAGNLNRDLLSIFSPITRMLEDVNICTRSYSFNFIGLLH